MTIQCIHLSEKAFANGARQARQVSVCLPVWNWCHLQG